MNTREKLLQDIETFLTDAKMSPSQFGQLTLNDTALVYRLRNGSDVRTGTADALREFMRENRDEALATAE